MVPSRETGHGVVDATHVRVYKCQIVQIDPPAPIFLRVENLLLFLLYIGGVVRTSTLPPLSSPHAVRT